MNSIVLRNLFFVKEKDKFSCLSTDLALSFTLFDLTNVHTQFCASKETQVLGYEKVDPTKIKVILRVLKGL